MCAGKQQNSATRLKMPRKTAVGLPIDDDEFLGRTAAKYKACRPVA